MARIRISRELSVAVALSMAIHAVWLIREARASSPQVAEVSEVTLETMLSRPKQEEVKQEISAVPQNSPPEAIQRSAPPKSQRATSSSALPSSAQAGKTLTAPDDGADADLADFTMVQGTGADYVGGTTSALGTSRKAVEGRARDVGEEERRPVVVAKGDSGPDRSRSATPIAPAWDCSRLFPSDVDAGDYATVLIAVSVDALGNATRVALLRDPGHGFGAAAIACARGQRFNTALDRIGRPIAATTPPIVVRFSR